jgi:hypothetical protein
MAHKSSWETSPIVEASRTSTTSRSPFFCNSLVLKMRMKLVDPFLEDAEEHD